MNLREDSKQIEREKEIHDGKDGLYQPQRIVIGNKKEKYCELTPDMSNVKVKVYL